MVVLGVAVLLTWLEDRLAAWVSIASLLGVMAMGFIILEKSEAIAHMISQKLKKLWVFAELLLFVLVGAQVNIHVAFKAGLAGTAVIFVGLIFRSFGTYVSLFGTDFSFKEKMFCIVSYIPKATVQAAIGAVPLAAGVASGEVILAIAVLSIFLTAPLGAFGIIILGEKVLDHHENSDYKFKELRESLGFPRVGQRVRHKKYDTVWKVIEEKESWIEKQGKTPAILLRFWEEEKSEEKGQGRTISHLYSKDDLTFHDHWEILYDW
jgi:NhaP-type Na+/H+ or K+/H+ antiporter